MLASTSMKWTRSSRSPKAAAPTLEGNKVTIVNIGREKVPARIRLIANDLRAWFDSELDNAVTHLTAAVEKVGTWETPMAPERHNAQLLEKLPR